MSTQPKSTDPSEMTDEELLEYIANTDTSLAGVARRALEADQEEDSE